MLETLEHTPEAAKYIKDELRTHIFGQCCTVKNDVHLSSVSKDYIKSKEKLIWLVENYGKYFKLDSFIDDFFIEVDSNSHWSTSADTLQELLNEAISEMRDRKISNNF
jgi:hypothetical protein